jgi:hypothetical protein
MTVAPGIAAPVESATVPETVAELPADWAAAGMVAALIRIKSRNREKDAATCVAR